MQGLKGQNVPRKSHLLSMEPSTSSGTLTATLSLRDNMDIRTLQKMLGHKSLATTEEVPFRSQGDVRHS